MIAKGCRTWYSYVQLAIPVAIAELLIKITGIDVMQGTILF